MPNGRRERAGIASTRRGFRRQRARIAIAVAAGLIGVAKTAHAQWVSNTGGSWNTASNWYEGV
ncbi:MAG: hypothetical protein ABSG31_08730 [Tepidisphaeraceae bacterium]|jgi:hypothetical protein